MSLPTSLSLDKVHIQVIESEPSPRDDGGSPCASITNLFFESSHKRKSVHLVHEPINANTSPRRSTKIQNAIEHSPVGNSKIKKVNLERSKSFHGVSFQDNLLYTPPAPINKRRSIRLDFNQLPLCRDVISEVFINNDWLGKLEKSVLHGTNRMEKNLSEIRESWVEKIQEKIDQSYCEELGYSCLSEEIFLKPSHRFPEGFIKESFIDDMVLLPYIEILKRLAVELDAIVIKLNQKTDLLVAFRGFLQQMILKQQTVKSFLQQLGEMAEYKSLWHLLQAALSKDEKHPDLINTLLESKKDAERLLHNLMKELRWLQDNALKVGKYQVFRWNDKLGTIDKIVREQVSRSITMHGHRLIDLTINGQQTGESLEQIVHQINQAGIDPLATPEESAQQAQQFLKENKYIPAEGILRGLSMGSWYHADQLIRKWLGDIYELPLHAMTNQGTVCAVQITDLSEYDVRQIKSLNVYRRRLPNDPECYTVIKPEIGQITFQWMVRLDEKLNWQGELRIVAWHLRPEAPIGLKWLFMKALTHYHA